MTSLPLILSSSHLLGQVGQELGSLRVMVGFAVQFDRLEVLLLVEEVAGVLGQEALDLGEVVLLGERDRLVPLVEQHTAVDRFLRVTSLQGGGDKGGGGAV